MRSNSEIRFALYERNTDLTINLIHKYGVEMYNDTMYHACCIGCIPIIEELIRLGLDDWNEYMAIACGKGNVDLINMMIIHGANDWNKGLSRACIRGNVVSINFMVEKGATDFDQGLAMACYNHHIDIVQLMIEKGANINYALHEACKSGYIDIIDIVITAGASEWNFGLYGACEGANIDIINDMITRGASDWDGGFIFACNGVDNQYIEPRVRCKDAIMLMVSNGCDDDFGKWGQIIESQSVFSQIDVDITEILMFKYQYELPAELIYLLRLSGISRHSLKKYENAHIVFNWFDRYRRSVRWKIYQNLQIHDITNVVLEYLPRP